MQLDLESLPSLEVEFQILMTLDSRLKDQLDRATGESFPCLKASAAEQACSSP
jgi:hypothetical protein